MRRFILSIVFALLCASFASAEEQFSPIFNGKDLTGWRVRGGFAKYSVEDGLIVGQCVPNTPGNTFLCTEKEYGDFILRMEVKYIVSGNSGVQVRSHAVPSGERERVFGYQCEIANRVAVGQIYDEGRRGWGYSSRFRGLKRPDDSFPKDAPWPFLAKEWNQIEIQCVGPSIRTWVNGVPCADMIDVLDADGFIGLQVHAGRAGTLQWRNLEIAELPAGEWKAGSPKDLAGVKNWVLRTELSEEEILALCPAGKSFLKGGKNSYAAAVIGDRGVQIINGKEVSDVSDAKAASELGAKLAALPETLSLEVMVISDEMKAKIER